MSAELPEDIDPELWFPCQDQPGHRDYLYNARWPIHTSGPPYPPARFASGGQGSGRVLNSIADVVALI